MQMDGNLKLKFHLKNEIDIQLIGLLNGIKVVAFKRSFLSILNPGQRFSIFVMIEESSVLVSEWKYSGGI